MASAGAIRAGRAFIELFADATKLDAGLAQASAKLKAWGNSIKSLGHKMAFLGGAIVAPIAVAALKIAGLEKASQRIQFKRDTGVAVSANDVAQAKEFSVALAGVGAHLALIAVKIGSAVTPVLRQFGAWLEKISATASEWISKNESLVQTLFVVGTGVTVVGAGLVVLGTGVGLVAAAISGLGILTSVVLSPFAIALAAIGAGLYKLGATDGIGDTLAKSLTGFMDAVQGGNIELAFQIVFKGIELAWAQMLDNMRDNTQKWLTTVAGAFSLLGGNKLIHKMEVAGNTRSIELGVLRAELGALLEQARDAKSHHIDKNLAAGVKDAGAFTKGVFGGLMAGQALGGGNATQEKIQQNTKGTVQAIEKLASRARPFVFS